MLKDLSFNSFEFNNRKEVLVGVDTTRNYVIKIQLVANTRKERSLKGEFEVMKRLNTAGCVTCPLVYEYNTVSTSDLAEMVRDKEQQEALTKPEYEYIIQQYIPDSGTATLADIVLAMLEQKKLGVYQADIKPGNIRFDISKSLCYIIDYDQAIDLTEEQQNYSNSMFFKFCSVYDKEKHGIGNWLRHYPQYGRTDLSLLFRGDSFNLGATTIIQTQKTTNSITGIYHTIEGDDVYAEGSRKMDTRAAMLDTLTFEEGEKVLDIGCNTGLLCMYLHNRGCKTTGVDNDPRVVIAAKIIANILGDDIDYFHLDLDDAPHLKDYDTVMLFSVLHHTRNVEANAKKIADSCNRIILEARLFEHGAQPYGEEWVRTSAWNYNTWEEFYQFCETIFPGFELKKNLGLGSKNRNILELVRT